MAASVYNKNEIYSTLKRLRNDKSPPDTEKLITALGEFHGPDILEGFASDAEFLGRPPSDQADFDKDFYHLCQLDNLYIFTLKDDVCLDMPPMSVEDFNAVINKVKMKKAGDIYQLTAEHIKYCGAEAQLCILCLIS